MDKLRPAHDLQLFRLPRGFRGRGAGMVQLWWLIQSVLFKNSPQFLYPWRVFLLRAFGARIGKGVKIRPSATITFPWKLSIDDFSWIGDDVVLYSLGEITIGAHSIVSQKSYLCAGSHDFTSRTFRILSAPIIIGSGVWVAADVFIGPSVTIGDGTVVGARSSVFRNLPAMSICRGSPARIVATREISSP